MTQFIIEKDPTPEIIERFVAMIRAYAGEYFTENFADDVAIDAPFQRLCYLKSGDEIASGIMFTCLDGCPNITAMVTAREHKNKGYGKQLMEHFVEHLTQLGFREIELYAWSVKTKPVCVSTQAFYRSVGFVVTREYVGLWRPESDWITVKMRKTW